MKPLIKTRFAPSPTGMMHVGNFRTALFAYLFAKKHNGKFILRIEDTDKDREVKGAEQAIFRVLKWAGLGHDEGPDIDGPSGPYRQSERLNIYQKYIKELLKKDGAYYCFCSEERLKKVREEQEEYGRAVRYDRHCLNLDKGEVEQKLKAKEPYVIRQKIKTDGETKFKDLVHGEIIIQNEILDDSVLIKSDGWPTYNFANVVDDHLMQITHIIRGDEYIPSTAKFIQLYQAFGWQSPELIHLPLILDKSRAKLSKRHGDVAVEDFIQAGYLPETLINFIVLLGWNPGIDRELFSLDELVKEFSFDKVNKSGAVFDLDKLDWMNGHYIRQKSLDELTELCMPYLEEYLGKNYELRIMNYENDFIKFVVGLEQDRLKKLSEIGERTKYFFAKPEYDKKLLIWQKSNQAETKKRFKFLIDYLAKVPQKNWTRYALEEYLLHEIKVRNLGNGDTLWPMRVALSGEEKSPSPFEIAEVLGQQETLSRLEQALSKI